MKTFVLCLLVVATALGAPSGKPHFKRGMNKIVGGSDVVPGELPYQVSFQVTSYGHNIHFCGGSIYSEDWIITAGHCVDEEDFDHPKDLWIVAGDSNLKLEEGSEQKRTLSKIIWHEDYDEIAITYDISLLKLSSSLIFNEYVQPVALPKQMENSTGSAFFSGWGDTSEGSPNPTVLQSVSVPILSDEECRAEIGGRPLVPDDLICAGTGGKGSCQVDSGGPLVCTSGDSTYLCGIVSWCFGCAPPKSLGVYTEVSYYVDWIHTNTGVVM